jgi:hypothetical protein
LTFHAQVLQRVFVDFGDSYTLLDVYNIFEKLELAHAHYEAFITFKASTSTSYANQIITFFFKGLSGGLGCTHLTLQLLWQSCPQS